MIYFHRANSHLATASRTLRTHLCNRLKLGREGDTKKQYRHKHTDSQERVLAHVGTIWAGGRQYAGAVATQLLCVTAVCTYQLVTEDNMYTNNR